MKKLTARIISLVFGVALLTFMIVTAYSMLLLFVLGTITGIGSSEKTLGISHDAVVDATQFAIRMMLPIQLFLFIVAYAVSDFLHDKVHAMLMRRVDERPTWKIAKSRKKTKCV